MNSDKHRPSTIIDVAKQAGVSPSTISRVLNGTAVVAQETEQRVRKAIADLDFSPHPAARQLVTNRTNMIGVLLPEINDIFFQPMLKGIEAVVRSEGYDLLVYSTQDGLAVRPMIEHYTDGLLTFPGSISQTELHRLYMADYPVVLLHQTPPADSPYPFVTIENKGGAEMLVSHMIEVHDRRRIIFLRGPENHEDSVWREKGYRDALSSHGIPFDPSLVFTGRFNETIAFGSTQELLRQGVEFDAVFAGDDDAAAGVISALRTAGISVPADVSVVGFDDVPFSRFVSPPLTTIRAPIEEVGQTAMQQLIKLIRKQTVEPKILLPIEMIIRQSCGCV